MKLLKLTILCLLLTFGSEISKAQEGDFFLLHFQPNVNNVDFQNYDIAQDGNGLVCFANRKGVLKFDGQSWELIPTPSSVVSLTYDASHKRLYVGCRNGFGYISANQNGLESYKSLSGKQEFFGDISHVKVVGNWTYFLSENQLFEYSAADKEITRTFSSTSEQHFFNVFFHAREAYLFTEEQELFKITGKGLEKQSLEGLKKNSTLMFSKSLDVRRSILGTAEGEMYVWKGDKLIPIGLQEKEYLKDHNLINGEVLNDSVMILSTLSGGIVSVNWRTGKTIGIIDYDSGLPDNEIYSLFKDENKNIWITHEYGITLLEFHIPMRVYSNYLGLNGNITSVIEHNNRLYVGTSTGLFYLDEATSLVEVQKLIKQRKEQKTISTRLKTVNNNPVTQPNLSRSESIAKAEEEEEDKKKKSGWLKKLFKKKNRRKNKKGKDSEGEEDEMAEKEIDAEKNAGSIINDSLKIEEEANKRANLKKTRNSLKSVRIAIKETSLGYHVYKRVEGIEGKCLQLIPFGNKILVGSNSGVYEVDGDKARSIFQEPVRYLHFSEKQRNIFMSTYDNRVVLMNFKNNRWGKLPYFEEFRDEISAFSQDDNGNLWMTGTNYIYKVQLDGKGRPNQAFPFEISNPFNDVIQAINLDEKPYFLLSSGAFYYDENLDGIMFDSAMTKELGVNLRVLHSQPSKVWVMKGRDWMMFSENETMKINSHKSLNYLRLAGDLSGAFLDEPNNKLWAINKNNELFQIGLGSYSKINHGYSVFLKHIKSSSEKYFKLGDFEVEKGSDELHFYFTTPAYFESDGVTYQYKLEGHDKGWSSWTNKNDVSYLSLPAGTYRLQVRGKSASGKLSEITPVSFEVVPPYWERPWFYGSEVLFFATLLFLSYRLNSSKKAGKTTKIISQILTVFTLILIVEFIQVTIEAKVVMKSTPVTNFLVQAGIALCVFPLERLLAYFIRQEHKRKTKKKIEEVKKA